MGNRAVITTEDKRIGVYVHWNGGRDSVEAFIEYCKIKGYTAPERDNYGWARLCQVISNFFGGSLSIGIDTLDNLDCGNMFVIKNWEIIGRNGFKGTEQDSHNRIKMLIGIDKAQPVAEQFGEEFFTAETRLESDLKIGDTVFVQDFTGKNEKFEIVGQVTTQGVLKKEQLSRVNGHNVLNKFYIDKYDDVCGHTNINNFLLRNEYKVVK